MTGPSRESETPDPTRLPPTHAPGVAELVVQLAAAGLPLESGLRAAAEESADARLSAALRRLAAALERGESLDALPDETLGLTEPIRYLLNAQGIQNPSTAGFSEMVLAQSFFQTQRRAIIAALTYPSVLLVATFAIFLFFQFLVTQPLHQMISEFAIRLPPALGLVLWWGNVGVWFLLAFCAVIAFCGVLLWCFAPRGLGDRVMISIPYFGNLMRWTVTAQLARLAALLLRARAPLPQALTMSSRSLGNVYLARSVTQIAEATQQGIPLDAAVQNARTFPPTLVPWLSWGLETDRVVEGWDAAATVFEERVRLRTQFLKIVFPPLVFLCICFILVVMLASISLPIYYFLRFMG